MPVLTTGAGVFPASGGVTFSLAWVAHQEVTVDTTTPTYSAIGIGAANSNRVVAIAFGSRQTNSTDTVSSVRVHTPDMATDPTGVSATHVTGAFQGGAALVCTDVWYIQQSSLTTPTATTADIVVTWSASSLRSSLATYRIVTGTPTPSASNINTGVGTGLTQSITVPASGGALAIYINRAPATTADITWTNAVKDYTAPQIEGAGTATVGSATVSGTGSVNVTASISTGAVSDSMSLAAWDT